MKFAISKQNILDYYNTIKNYTHRTPVLTSDYFTKEVGAKGMYFKCENVQKTGSFKIRGAINAISYNLKNEPELSKNGFITHSSGNHAAAMACAGKILGVNVSVSINLYIVFMLNQLNNLLIKPFITRKF